MFTFHFAQKISRLAVQTIDISPLRGLVAEQKALVIPNGYKAKGTAVR
jgi:hypothetical protein